MEVPIKEHRKVWKKLESLKVTILIQDGDVRRMSKLVSKSYDIEDRKESGNEGLFLHFWIN